MKLFYFYTSLAKIYVGFAEKNKVWGGWEVWKFGKTGKVGGIIILLFTSTLRLDQSALIINY
ncbi:hypothetical protein CYANOKiyG1_37280 [Okeania sp. KiyG1]|nr:hypothetical protein CYANOKiyG1_37280 [Okeania sp. KiyG1]